MALYVNTNVSSLNSQRKLTNAVNNLNVSYQRLSSGLRINSARDDAAGLQISDRLTAQINGLNQGNRNTNDGIALAQTIEGALDESTNMLQRIRTLAVQAANGTNTEEDRASIQQEVTQLCTEISRIARKTTYAGAKVLDGADKDNLTWENNLVPPLKVGVTGTGTGTANPDAGLIKFQVGSNANDTVALDVKTGFTFSAMADHLNFTVPNAAADKASAEGIKLTATQEIHFSVSDAEAAQNTLAHIDEMIGFIDSKRAEFGAMQNRMESTIRNQANISENESDARSRIRDTDFASETAALTQNNIIQNASQTILAQANQRPQIALQLLG